MYDTVLVAVDMGEQTDYLIQRAKMLVDKPAGLHILHVLEQMEAMYLGGDWLGGGINMLEIQGDIRRLRCQQIEALVEKHDLGVKQFELREGGPAEEIRNHANAIGAEVIVVGTHGRHGLDLLLGSISNGVLHGTPCDVLAVRVK